jgi:hypothetical protein
MLKVGPKFFLALTPSVKQAQDYNPCLDTDGWIEKYLKGNKINYNNKVLK